MPKEAAPKKTIQTLISDLHNRFGEDLNSPQQQALMKKLQAHVHNFDEADSVDLDFKDTLNLLLEDIEVQHPKAAGIIREVMTILSNMEI